MRFPHSLNFRFPSGHKLSWTQISVSWTPLLPGPALASVLPEGWVCSHGFQLGKEPRLLLKKKTLDRIRQTIDTDTTRVPLAWRHLRNLTPAPTLLSGKCPSSYLCASEVGQGGAARMWGPGGCCLIRWDCPHWDTSVCPRHPQPRDRGGL